MQTELTILMPCLNEEKTVGYCVIDALNSMKKHNIEGNVLVVDNGSTDKSHDVAKDAGAAVITKFDKGYGNALLYGIHDSNSKYIIMADCDRSYDFSTVGEIIDLLREGNQLVVGDRFGGNIEHGAMPVSHRYLGNPMISAIGRFVTKSNVADFYCGLRGFDRQSILDLDLKSTGMTFALEMIVKSAEKGYKISNVPIILHRDGRCGKSHLNTIKDGMRSVNYLLTGTVI